MNLHEYQAKRLFAAGGIPVPEGVVAETVEEAQAAAERLGGTVAVKAQVLVGGRGKAGGILLAHSPEEAAQAAARLLGHPLKGLTVRHVLVEKAARIADELYMGLVIDREAGAPAFLVSSEGGVDIEETARIHPGRVHTIPLDPYWGLRSYHAVRAAQAIALPRERWGEFAAMAQALYQVARGYDATLAEINPLVVTEEGHLLALDAKIILDDSALYRHKELAAQSDLGDESPAEAEARRGGISYVKLDGEIGCMVNGAGLAMATMDVIKLFGGEPANFLDIGGGARRERVVAALHIILSDPNVRSVLINIFGGITRCDEVAQGIVEALAQRPVEVPVVVRLVGTNGEEGRRILREANLLAAETLSEGARLAVQMARQARRGT
ncbi:MAG: ADP-forming succinate--CoA ligase subunit beta [Chloroflexi bacterium]|nr:ADP-forming succinate--CoA ligase subunit beta [Chloroflexota bacterium]